MKSENVSLNSSKYFPAFFSAHYFETHGGLTHSGGFVLGTLTGAAMQSSDMRANTGVVLSGSLVISSSSFETHRGLTFLTSYIIVIISILMNLY